MGLGVERGGDEDRVYALHARVGGAARRDVQGPQQGELGAAHVDQPGEGGGLGLWGYDYGFLPMCG